MIVIRPKNYKHPFCEVFIFLVGVLISAAIKALTDESSILLDIFFSSIEYSQGIP
jgi:hypothetical protein